MYDDDRDALAAEYVLGTLAADEREQAEALLVIDPGFAEIVRVWERRLGELNVMVEAVDPPPDLWDKIRSEIETQPHEPAPIETAEPPFEHASPEIAPEAHPEADPRAGAVLRHGAGGFVRGAAGFGRIEPAAGSDVVSVPQDLDELNPPRDLDEPAPNVDDASLVDALASSLLEPEHEQQEPEVAAETLLPPELPPTAPPPAERTAEIIRLRRGVRRWRGVTGLMTAIAAVLALFVAVTQFAPGLIPMPRQPQPIAAQPPAPGARLTAVLKQEPTAPAFLLTVDPQNKSFTVRTVSATPEAGRSYQLWLIAGKNAGPRSLGLVGGEEFTTRPLPAGFDVATIRTADYAVSLEPAGGSPTGAPTGPILFTGKMFESVPGSPS